MHAPCFLPRNAADARRWVSLNEATPIVTVLVFLRLFTAAQKSACRESRLLKM